jgi:hypothetical protein
VQHEGEIGLYSTSHGPAQVVQQPATLTSRRRSLCCSSKTHEVRGNITVQLSSKPSHSCVITMTRTQSHATRRFKAKLSPVGGFVSGCASCALHSFRPLGAVSRIRLQKGTNQHPPGCEGTRRIRILERQSDCDLSRWNGDEALGTMATLNSCSYWLANP